MLRGFNYFGLVILTFIHGIYKDVITINVAHH